MDGVVVRTVDRALLRDDLPGRLTDAVNAIADVVQDRGLAYAERAGEDV
ncbi:MAG: hypothetical protein QOE25_41 [Actinomycetota bacterium]|nr:hypothetical protein [Actinomycetota bacterium]